MTVLDSWLFLAIVVAFAKALTNLLIEIDKNLGG